MVKFKDTENYIIGLFQNAPNKKFLYGGKEYSIEKCGRPISQTKGECKTDVYVLAKDAEGKAKEFKISIKQNNADFIENKIQLDRAIQILGSHAQSIIQKRIDTIKDKFTTDYLVFLKAGFHTGEDTIKLGWKYEFTNKKGGKKSGSIELTNLQKIEIYAGPNLSDDKKDSVVGGVIIKNSGVANSILIVDKDKDKQQLSYYLSCIKPIEEFAVQQNIYFACKALNYRIGDEKNKWDGDRPLAVYIHWSLTQDKKLCGEVIFKDPLSVRGNAVAKKLEDILLELKISSNNFKEIKNYLDPAVKIYE